MVSNLQTGECPNAADSDERRTATGRWLADWTSRVSCRSEPREGFAAPSAFERVLQRTFDGLVDCSQLTGIEESRDREGQCFVVEALSKPRRSKILHESDATTRLVMSNQRIHRPVGSSFVGVCRILGHSPGLAGRTPSAKDLTREGESHQTISSTPVVSRCRPPRLMRVSDKLPAEKDLAPRMMGINETAILEQRFAPT